MLTHLSLNNFKSWQTLDLPLARVTGLFGTNSSGKSSILQFLLMLKQTKDATDRGLVLDLGGQNQLVNLGSYKSLIYKHQEDLSLKWTINWKGYIKPQDTTLFNFEISVDTFFKKKEMQVKFLRYQFNQLISEVGGMFCEMKLQNESIKDYEFKTSIGFLNKEPISDTVASASPIKTYIFPDDIKKVHRARNVLIDVEFVYEKLMDKIYYLAPLREYPQREYQWRGLSRSSVGYRGEYTIEVILAATFRNETRIIPESNEEKPFQEVIAYWLKQLGLIHEFKLKEIAEGTGLFHAIVKKDPKSTEAFLTDVGFGVSQVLPAIVLLYYVPEGSIILMEQPEIHLHPSVQSGLADVILQVSKQRNIQVIVESHSEHLLQRFQRRIAEESYPVDELKLYFCDSKNGESKLMDLEIDEYGDIKNYPDNFFGDEMAEIAATRIAGLQRKMKAAEKNGG
jgi:predicted ATPase